MARRVFTQILTIMILLQVISFVYSRNKVPGNGTQSIRTVSLSRAFLWANNYILYMHSSLSCALSWLKAHYQVFTLLYLLGYFSWNIFLCVGFFFNVNHSLAQSGRISNIFSVLFYSFNCVVLCWIVSNDHIHFTFSFRYCSHTWVDFVMKNLLKCISSDDRNNSTPDKFFLLNICLCPQYKWDYEILIETYRMDFLLEAVYNGKNYWVWDIPGNGKIASFS